MVEAALLSYSGAIGIAGQIGYRGATQVAIPTGTVSANLLHIANRLDNGRPMDGDIYTFGVWDYVMTPAEVAERFAQMLAV